MLMEQALSVSLDDWGIEETVSVWCAFSLLVGDKEVGDALIDDSDEDLVTERGLDNDVSVLDLHPSSSDDSREDAKKMKVPSHSSVVKISELVGELCSLGLAEQSLGMSFLQKIGLSVCFSACQTCPQRFRDFAALKSLSLAGNWMACVL